MSLRLEKNGLMKNIPTGFSFTTFFFGALVPAFRGDLKYFFIMLFTDVITAGLAYLIWPFIYNRKYRDTLIEDGWSLITEKRMEAA